MSNLPKVTHVSGWTQQDVSMHLPPLQTSNWVNIVLTYSRTNGVTLWHEFSDVGGLVTPNQCQCGNAKYGYK